MEGYTNSYNWLYIQGKSNKKLYVHLGLQQLGYIRIIMQ